MFERQIRLSRYDCDKLSHASTPIHSRVNHPHREVLSPNRSRSISPNDMALRQRRAAPISTSTLAPSARFSLPASTSYPDLVISHTPLTIPSSELKKTLNEDSAINTRKAENTIVKTNSNRPNLSQTSISLSDTTDNQPLDFKSRLALFNRTNTLEHSHTSIGTKKPSNHSLQSNFFTKPILHHYYSSEKQDSSSDQNASSAVDTTKSITFFGGTTITENTESRSPARTIDEPLDCVPDVIGGNVKLTKSSIFSGMKKVLISLLQKILCFYNLGCSSTIYR